MPTAHVNSGEHHADEHAAELPAVMP